MATLKISDLSVGDWVRDANGIIVQILDIENWPNRYILDARTISGDICCLSGEGALPILITPEILKANGWRVREEDEYMEYYRDPTCGIDHTKGTYRYRFDVTDVSVVCYFVHQLQHALRLAGVGKEIIL